MLGTFAKAILCAALGQVPADVDFSNSRAQKVEVNFPPERRAEIRELLLFASPDQGKNWSQVGKILPEQREFQFSLPVDGFFWLRVAAITREGKQDPENLYDVQPNRKLVIDTLRPLMKITSAVRTGAEVAVAWELREDHPEWTTFRLEYLTSPGGPAIPITAAPGLTGVARFNPSTNGPVAVRLALRDKAGNESVVTADVAGQNAIASDSPPPPAVPSIGQVTLPPTDFSTAQAPPSLSPAAPAMPIDKLPSQSIESVGAAIPGNPSAKSYPAPERPRTLTPPGSLSPASNARWTPNASAAHYQTAPERVEAPIASTAFPPVQQIVYQAPAPPPVVRKADLPKLRYVKSAEVVLEYQLSKVGPSRVGSVDIYLTRDDGQNWEHVLTDPYVVGKDGAGLQQGIAVLPGDGVYGFTLVVKSQAQIRQEMTSVERKSKGPRNGDVPDIRVEVDTTPPTAELFPPKRDTSKPNSLLLIWKAEDKNLDSSPITLEWAKDLNGKWHEIAKNIPNTGKYSWQLPNELPVEVYLRLRARDVVGNVGTAVTPDPQIVDINEPEGRLVGIGEAPQP